MRGGAGHPVGLSRGSPTSQGPGVVSLFPLNIPTSAKPGVASLCPLDIHSSAKQVALEPGCPHPLVLKA
eukprot:1159601-Pelagomonas_calceolata.AAC.3